MSGLQTLIDWMFSGTPADSRYQAQQRPNDPLTTEEREILKEAELDPQDVDLPTEET